VAPRAHLFEAFRQGLRDLGYTEGQNIAIELRSAEGQFEKLPELAAELVRLPVDVIVTATTPASLAAKQATTTIPIVMAVVVDAVGSGLVASLSRPGGNITGLDLLSADIAGKRLEILKESVPRASRVAALRDPRNPASARQWAETQIAARTLGIQLQSLEVRATGELESAFRAATTERADALIALDDAFLFTHQALIADLAAKHRVPVISGFREFVEAGGLMAYGTHLPALYRRAATYVDRILKGARTADLPVEQPTQFELLINLKAAKALGLTFPQTILIRADQVIQ
jgi:putative ABC transport system substrate-binding protein